MAQHVVLRDGLSDGCERLARAPFAVRPRSPSAAARQREDGEEMSAHGSLEQEVLTGQPAHSDGAALRKRNV